jgi:hypothetical protein
MMTRSSFPVAHPNLSSFKTVVLGLVFAGLCSQSAFSQSNLSDPIERARRAVAANEAQVMETDAAGAGFEVASASGTAAATQHRSRK